MTEKTKIIKVEVPESVHTDFKIMCAAKQENMKDRAMGLVEIDIANWKHGTEQTPNTKGIDPSEILPILCKAIEGKTLEDIELALLADTLDIDQAVLQHCRDKNTNGNKRTKNTPCLS
ncbi:hypothetical protein [Planktothrix agardhii]|uniref:hypothetical protein n=1 Tax=Planktothrix agardhii TaxID=1160 RepID=UPI002B1FB89B|nr:hypothetical protein [Planktothrix agardhii]MEA5561436.1 hypothetical protein [Planktothrix agardhii UHCC 0887]